MSSEALLDSISAHLTNGSMREARAELARLFRRRIPRSQAARAANLARRAYQPEKSLRLLHRFVRSAERGRKVSPSTDAEKAEYAMALSYFGATREALSLLDEVDFRATPNADLFRSMTLARRWDFEAAIPGFERLKSNAQAHELTRLRATFELAAALLDGRGDFKGALKVLGPLASKVSPTKFRPIHKDLLLVQAQCELAAGQAAAALETLKRLEALCREESDAMIQLHVEQWRWLARLGVEGRRPELLRGLHGVRDRFLEARRFDDARFCDFQEARLCRDAGLLARLYFGTPMPAFKERARRLAGDEARAWARGFEWKLGEGEPSGWVDIATGTSSYSAGSLKPGDLIQRLLQALSLDHYKPLHLAELHEWLYPDEHYNAESSPDKIHRVILRARSWLRANRVPLAIDETESLYRLRARSGAVVLRLREQRAEEVHRTDRKGARLASYVGALESAFGARFFSMTEAASQWRASERTTLRWLAAARDAGLVEQRKSGPTTSYRLLKSSRRS